MSLFSSLGGALSFYLGISIIAALEVFEYLSLLLINLARFFLGIPQKSKPEDEKQPQKTPVIPVTKVFTTDYAENKEGKPALKEFVSDYDQKNVDKNQNTNYNFDF